MNEYKKRGKDEATRFTQELRIRLTSNNWKIKYGKTNGGISYFSRNQERARLEEEQRRRRTTSGGKEDQGDEAQNSRRTSEKL